MNQSINIADLSTTEKVSLAEQLWESIEKEYSLQLTQQQQDLVITRIKLHQQHPNQGIPWADVKRKYL